VSTLDPPIRHDVLTTGRWLGTGTAFFATALERVPDGGFRASSRLPGWTRAHVTAHVARNADALHRLLAWAATGVETPMYADRAQRAAEIEEGAGAPDAELRVDVARTAARLDAAIAGLPDEAWQAEVRSALGRRIPAAEVLWMRVREVWLHAVDLDTGARVTELPVEVVETLLDDVTGAFGSRDGTPRLELVATDRDRQWRVGENGGAVRVSGEAAALLAWLTGRSGGTELGCSSGLPALPAWL
jgi:maleylpyruvate isomerase